MKLQTIACLLALYGLTGCAKNTPLSTAPNPTPIIKANMATSVSLTVSDVSWLTQMEASDINLQQQRCTAGPVYRPRRQRHQCHRLRVWVNPSGSWCNINDVVKKSPPCQSSRHEHYDRLSLQRYLGRPRASNQTCRMERPQLY